ncbi:bifunctional pyr operon transcriptional regulator/uracil phosphoribosyltransferase PyrR [Vagococcus coleopterorum]|uniref:Bifunctional protein PyrR n=1 Tax=Vagococcus coleopterorum TaxID=2714946 RepID=A0A6G8ANB8_9ENTE|nr:bifunctional pyr operon transcriptional regulator/uracil phosphoribosyltransferase PyrR [Vagococcus coleopterorum]QIL46496.1 bifunctional pyr operon transcriptional regulator/uracil phosphoribosyltransferase PyrR [Vagococcus coleopterorum]
MSEVEVFDAQTMARTISRISYEIIERYESLDDLVLVGIKTRGIFIAERLANRLSELSNVRVFTGELDITTYRDDQKLDMTPDPTMSKIPESLAGKKVILVDDVLYTGRTIRAALDAVMDHGRPASIALAVLVDRGHRELPIRADFVGKNLPTAVTEEVEVKMVESDGEDRICLIK